MFDVEICRWDQLSPEEGQDQRLAELDHVFFSSSRRQSFEDAADRGAFRERWLGRYLLHFPQYTWVARDEGGHIVGYLAGSLDDPARDPLFADLPFFAHFSALTARYPAQLHVNLDAHWRGHGIGARLVDTFADQMRTAGAPGVHVVTSRDARNVRFYLANGFLERGTLRTGDAELLFLGRDL